METLFSGKTERDRQMEERMQMMDYEEEREIDLKQLALVILTRWKVLLVGSVREDRLKKLQEALSGRLDGISLACAAGIHENASALQELKSYDDVILVEECFRSRFEETDREMQLLRDWGKNVIGAIVLA